MQGPSCFSHEFELFRLLPTHIETYHRVHEPILSSPSGGDERMTKMGDVKKGKCLQRPSKLQKRRDQTDTTPRSRLTCLSPLHDALLPNEKTVCKQAPPPRHRGSVLPTMVDGALVVVTAAVAKVFSHVSRRLAREAARTSRTPCESCGRT